MITPKLIRLANKSRLLVVPMKGTEAVTVLIIFRAGHRYETKDINGIAHFLEHMFFKGGKKYKDSQAVAAAIDAIGGEFNAFTSNEWVGYYVKVGRDHIDRAFDVLSDMLTSAKFEQSGLERERGVILEEYKMIQDQPRSNVWRDFEMLIFGDQPMGWSTIGLPEVIKRVTRQDFIDYQTKLYTAANMVVAVAGNTSVSEGQRLVRKYLPLPKSEKLNIPLPYQEIVTGKRMTLQYKKTEQAHLMVGVPTFGDNHPDRFAAQVLANILGGGMSSRLFINVREKHGLAYYVRAGSYNYTDCGYLAASAGVDTSRLDLALKTILGEFKALTKTSVSASELAKAKEHIVGHMMLELESSDEVAMHFGFQELLNNKIESVEQFKRKIRGVTAAQVLRVAKTIFKDNNLVLSIVGPYKDASPIKAVYKL